MTPPESNRQVIVDFPLSWRWFSEAHHVLPAIVLDDLTPLPVADARQIDTDARNRCMEAPIAEFTESFSAEWDAADSVRERLIMLPIAPEQQVLVSWSADLALVTSWRTFRTYWDAFCYPSSDDVSVWDPNAAWTVCYRHFQFIQVRMPPEMKIATPQSGRFHLHDVTYSLLRGSDVQRDGMYLELYAAASPDGAPLAEWFYSDITGAMVLTEYEAGIPSAVADWFQWRASHWLPVGARAI